MDILTTHGHVDVSDLGDVEVDLRLYDWPTADIAYPFTWSAVIVDGPPLAVGAEGELHVDIENTGVGHPFVVIASSDHRVQICGHEHARTGAPDTDRGLSR